ncbi:aminoglycoside phosphotransferase [Nocardioides sp. GY 10127]|uniref:aminoglycoside phosphotransferase n=1 Tax=Nocardioides sp. GY 10127 TaxID=2569762 RepID=UPI0010A8341E|nr:aminoglycoside phosphotransferase [Nocardioides sp. GY 10127]TIC81821.1 aminoglycoside phosphotransferase [Nocardioides sp. GY 10127]
MPVPPRVLDLFAVPGPARALPGGPDAHGSAVGVVAGDLALLPDRDADLVAAVAPVQARLAVRLDEAPNRSARDLRLALPVPARDGSWVVDGWAAARFEPSTEVCTDVPVVLGAGRLLHALLAVTVRTPPSALAQRGDRAGWAERVAFGEVLLPEGPVTPGAAGMTAGAPDGLGAGEDVARQALDLLAVLGHARDPRPAQLAHAGLAGSVLLDGAGAPLVLPPSPAWRPAPWAEALAVLDLVLAWGAPPVHLEEQAADASGRVDLLRAIAYRALTAGDDDAVAHRLGRALVVACGPLVG